MGGEVVIDLAVAANTSVWLNLGLLHPRGNFHVIYTLNRTAVVLNVGLTWTIPSSASGTVQITGDGKSR